MTMTEKDTISETTPETSETVGIWAKAVAWLVRYLLPLMTMGVFFLMTGTAIGVLFLARSTATQPGFLKDFLVNAAAGCLEIAVGTVFAALIAWAVTKSKFQQVSRPVLALIQRLRIDGKLTEEGARRSVVFAVALLSESNVSKAIEEGPRETGIHCPICAQKVNERMDKCFYCKLPKKIWSDEKLTKVYLSDSAK